MINHLRVLSFVFYSIICSNYRLFHTSECSSTNDSNKVASIKRQRRHNVRKIILVLAYIIDSAAGLAFFCMTMIGNNSIFQEQIMVGFLIFTYSIPVPLAHLFSEVRVRTIIIEKGWYLGLKSIFQTTEEIRKENVEFQQLRIDASGKKKKRFKKRSENTNNRNNMDPNNECTDNLRSSDNEKDLKRLKNIEPQCDPSENDKFLAHIPHCQDDLDIELSLHLHKENVEVDHISGASSCLSLPRADYMEEAMTPLYDLEQTINGTSRLHLVNQGTTNVLNNVQNYTERDGDMISHPCISIDTTNIVSEFPEDSSKVKLSTSSDHSINRSTINLLSNAQNYTEKDGDMISHPLICNDTTKIESEFPEDSSKVMKILVDENFKMFSRSYILHKVLKLLNGDTKETLYQKHYEFICVLEGYPTRQGNGKSLPNFIIPLINAWYFTRKGNIEEGREHSIPNPDGADNVGEEENNLDKTCKERIRIIQGMLLHKNNISEYQKYLEELYKFEQNHEDENIFGW